MGYVTANHFRLGLAAQRQQQKLREQRTVRVPSQVLYRVDHALRGATNRQEQRESVMQRLGPLFANWDLTEDQLQFVKDRVEEQFNLGRHADTITEDELITMQAFAVDHVYS
jgi:hypothetical protein